MKGVIAVLTLNHIGDVLFTEPAITALRAGYPTDRLVVITSGEGQAVLANHPAIDALWVRERTLTGWWRLVKRLRKIAPSLVVSFSPSSFGLALAAFLSGASKRFGFSVRPVQWRFFTTALPFRSERHVADDYLALAEAAGGKREAAPPAPFPDGRRARASLPNLAGAGLGRDNTATRLPSLLQRRPKGVGR
jgi:ADP-heptose:LPS heptosyltransferase